MGSNLAVRARARKDRSVGRDFDHSLSSLDMVERFVQSFEMLVRAQDLVNEYRWHTPSFMRYGQLMLHLECMR